jgi:lauroyl/myristoyl acyltransferase
VTIARELRAGRAVGFLVDLPSRVPCARCRLFGADADLPLGAARIALAQRAAVVVGTTVPGGAVRVSRIACDGLAGPEGERTLLDRLAAELDARIRLGPEAWLGLFAPPRAPPCGEASRGRGQSGAPMGGEDSLRNATDSR